MIGGLASAVRLSYCYLILDKINQYKSVSEAELDKIISKYESKNFFRKLFEFFSSENANYESAKAVKNMRILGLESFVLNKKTVFGLFEELNRLEHDARAI